jgi:hypothetical protein
MQKKNILHELPALVVDNNIFSTEDGIYSIVKNLENAGQTFIKKENIPESKVWKEFPQFSYIILDWDLNDDIQLAELGVTVGQTISAATLVEQKKFIKYMIKNYFCPIFIFSRTNVDSIRNELLTDSTISEYMNKEQVVIRNKSDLTSALRINKFFNNWITANRSSRVLKKFQSGLNSTVNEFFLKLNKLPSNWVDLVIHTIKNDHSSVTNADEKKHNIQFDLTNFLLNSLHSGFEPCDFDIPDIDAAPINITEQQKQEIYSSIKFIPYKRGVPNKHEGDVYQKLDATGKPSLCEFYINITAPCDIRKRDSLLVRCVDNANCETGEDNGENYSSKYPINFFLEYRCVVINLNTFRVERLTNPDELQIDANNKYKRIGRLTHPYITAVRQRFANFLTRQGVDRHPE